MLGAIIGDMVGSLYEFHPIKSKEFNIFDNKMRMTDDYLLINPEIEDLIKSFHKTIGSKKFSSK